MFSHLESLLHFVDQTIQSIASKYPAEVKCKPGCADCCHAMYDVSFIEAAYLASFFQNNRTIVEKQQTQSRLAAK